MEHRYSNLRNLKKKSVTEVCHSDLLSVYKCNFARFPLPKKPILNNFKQLLSKPTASVVVKLHMTMIRLHDFRIVKCVRVENPKLPPFLDINKSSFAQMPIFLENNSIWSYLIRMVFELNYFKFMQMDYPRWPVLFLFSRFSDTLLQSDKTKTED